MFALQNVPHRPTQMRGLSVQPFGDEATSGKFDLQLSMMEASGELWARFDYATDLFEASTIARLADHFVRLLDGIVGEPQRRVSELSLLGEAERCQLVSEWNDTAVAYPQHCLHELFAAQAARTPDAVAVTYDDAALSYGELEQRANQLAHYLRRLGVGPETVVGLCAERSLAMVVGLIGILKAGGAYLPLDPSYPAERLGYMLADAHVPVLLTQEALMDRLPAHDAQVVRLDADWPAIAAEPTTAPPSGGQSGNPAHLVFNSGSTGRPKGTLVTHGCVGRLLAPDEAHFGFGPGDLWTLFHSYAFDFSVWEIWGALLYGGRLVVVPYWVSRSPAEFHALLAREGVTVLNQTPSAFAQLMQADAAAPRELALRVVIFGGEALNFAELGGWLERHGAERPQLVNMYGITETTVHVTYRPVRRADVTEGGGSAIGRPLSDLQVYVLDRHMEPAPVGVGGGMYVGGAGLGRGYLGGAGLTAERFVPSPFGDGCRLYRSGDLARWRADGELEYLGRADTQVKLRGFRIELGEIEAALMSHGSVAQAVVVARPESGGEKRLVGYVVPVDGVTPDSDLRAHLKRTLPDYMVPQAFVILEQLPLSANGKLDRKALPAPDAPRAGQDYVAPRNEIEATLAGIFAEVLRLERVGIDDNFFELGGDSILSIQVVARANRAGLALTARQMFEQQTVAGLAAVAGTAVAVRAEQGAVDGEVPLTPIQHWFLQQEWSEPHHFNQAVLLEGRGLSSALVEQAIAHVVGHHDALRLRFARTAAGWRQAHAADGAAGFEHVDLGGLDPSAQAARLSARAQRLQAGPRPPAGGPGGAGLVCVWGGWGRGVL